MNKTTRRMFLTKHCLSGGTVLPGIHGRPVFGLQAGYITSAQFSVLVAVVIATAIIPTFIAQRWFSPELPAEVREEVQAEEEESL